MKHKYKFYVPDNAPLIQFCQVVWTVLFFGKPKSIRALRKAANLSYGRCGLGGFSALNSPLYPSASQGTS